MTKKITCPMHGEFFTLFERDGFKRDECPVCGGLTDVTTQGNFDRRNNTRKNNLFSATNKAEFHKMFTDKFRQSRAMPPVSSDVYALLSSANSAEKQERLDSALEKITRRDSE